MLAYRRTYRGQELVVLANMKASEADLGERLELDGRRLLIGNYTGEECGQVLERLRPYECRVYM
ncbi:MAG: hypothetical protein ACLR0U_33335 [Enterocloster clostridioformis]